MNTKSTGWAGYDHDGTAIVGSERNQYLDLPCVTVIGNREDPPKVFTEEEVNAFYVAGQASSPPTLNIGMGESTIPQWIVLHALTEWWNGTPLKGGSPDWKEAENMIKQVADSCGPAHTKTVTVDAIVKLAEEWDAYCVVTSADPDGIKDFRARLLKLIQQ